MSIFVKESKKIQLKIKKIYKNAKEKIRKTIFTNKI